MNRLKLVALTLVLTIAAGCGGGGSSTADPSGSAPPSAAPGPAAASPWTLVPTTNPLTVSPIVDDSRATVQEVPLTGGTITATAADGTIFTLTIPADALEQPVTISMTPVTLPSQPFGSGPATGVQFLPEGLAFYKPARLVITPPADAPVPKVGEGLAITWSGADNHVDLALAAAGNGLSMDLLHFSGYAEVSAKLGYTAGLISQLGDTPLGRLSDANAARLSSDKRIAEGSNETPAPSDAELAALQQQFDNEQVPALINSAGSSCAQGRSAFATLVALDRQYQLLGVGHAGYFDKAVGIVDAVANVCVDEEWKKCHDHHIIQDIIPASEGLERQLQLLGADSAVRKDYQVKLDNYVLQCLRFRVDYDSTASTIAPGPAGFNFSERMLASVNIVIDSANFTSQRITGHDALNSMSYAMKYNNACFSPVSVTPADSQLTVFNLTWAKKGGDPKNLNAGQLAYMKLDYFADANPSTHRVLDNCSHPPGTSDPVTLFTYTTSFLTSLQGPDNSFNPVFYNAWSDPATVFLNAPTSNGPIIKATGVCDGCAELVNTGVSFNNTVGAATSSTVTSLRITHTPSP